MHTKELKPEVKRLWDTYTITPDAPLVQREFGFYSMEEWKKQGLPEDIDRNEYFGFEKSGSHSLSGLGWCRAEFFPVFEDKIIEDRGEHEVIQDKAGRHLLVFKGRRSGFMPDYLDHPVKDKRTWEEKCKWRLNPLSKERYTDIEDQMNHACQKQSEGYIITQRCIGGYMYLRSLMGPEDLLYTFYDNPDLIHECMKTWLELADYVIARHQEHVTLDELFFGEDICYNNGPLISPDMIKEFIFPYYQQLITNIKSRQLDKSRHLYLQIDTDGFANPVIPLYKEIGMDVMSPFEVASGCDVVEIGKSHPDLVMTGGIDKRVLASTKKEIDAHIDYILPAMQKRGGYIPTCDHGVPAEVPLDNYMHYRKRCLEFA